MAGLLGRPIAVNENVDAAADEPPRALDKLFFKDASECSTPSASGRWPTATPDGLPSPTTATWCRRHLDTDEQVAATVAEWERANGLEVQDWIAVGREERGEDED